MMIETDVIYAHVKKKDWLKGVADRLMRRIEKGEFGRVMTYGGGLVSARHPRRPPLKGVDSRRVANSSLRYADVG